MKKSSINFDNFTFKYFTQEEPTLHDINLDIKQGEKILIVGASGSGKSTLGHCLNGLIPFAYKGEISGSVKLEGQETKEQKLHIISKTIGTVMQDTDAQFVGQSVGEDIAFSMENDCVETDEMRIRVGKISETVGLEKHLKNSPYEISGGQKQRTAIAGVLVDDVDILLFDEPLANLDPKTGRLAIEIIDDIHKNLGKTIIIIEHRIEDVLHRDVDRIILISDGKIVADMKPDEILKTDLFYKHGIREPLYVTLLKYANEDVRGMELSSVEKLDYSLIKSNLLKWVASEKITGNLDKETILQLKNVYFSYDGTSSPQVE